MTAPTTPWTGPYRPPGQHPAHQGRPNNGSPGPGSTTAPTATPSRKPAGQRPADRGYLGQGTDSSGDICLDHRNYTPILNIPHYPRPPPHSLRRPDPQPLRLLAQQPHHQPKSQWPLHHRRHRDRRRRHGWPRTCGDRGSSSRAPSEHPRQGSSRKHSPSSWRRAWSQQSPPSTPPARSQPSPQALPDLPPQTPDSRQHRRRRRGLGRPAQPNPCRLTRPRRRRRGCRRNRERWKARRPSFAVVSSSAAANGRAMHSAFDDSLRGLSESDGVGNQVYAQGQTGQMVSSMAIRSS